MSIALRLGIDYMTHVPRNLRVQLIKDVLRICRCSNSESQLVAQLVDLPSCRRATELIKQRVRIARLVHRCLIRALLNGVIKWELVSTYSTEPKMYLITQKGREWLTKSQKHRTLMRAWLLKESMLYVAGSSQDGLYEGIGV